MEPAGSGATWTLAATAVSSGNCESISCIAWLDRLVARKRKQLSECKRAIRQPSDIHMIALLENRREFLHLERIGGKRAGVDGSVDIDDPVVRGEAESVSWRK